MLAEALRVAGAIHDERERSWALSAVAEWLPADQPEVLAEALRVAMRSMMKESGSTSCVRWHKRLPADQPNKLAEALAGSGRHPGRRRTVLGFTRRVVARLSSDQPELW